MSETTVPADGSFETKPLREEFDYLAPDESEIRKLIRGRKGSLAHCTLPPGQISHAVKHKTVEELWYFLSGTGTVWRKLGADKRCSAVSPGTSLAVLPGMHFQFENTGDVPLEFVIATVPPWPGPHEAVDVDDLVKPTD